MRMLALLTLLLAAPLAAASTPAPTAAMRESDGLVRDTYGLLSAPSDVAAEAIARTYLADHARELGLPTGFELEAAATKRSLAATHHRFRQLWDGAPVVGGDLSVHIRHDGAVVAVHSQAVPAVAPLVDAVTALEAVRIAGDYAGGVARAAEAVVFADGSEGRHAWRVLVDVPAAPRLDEVLVDRADGRVLRARDTLAHFEAPANVWINPIVHARDPRLTDNRWGLEKDPVPGAGLAPVDFSQFYQAATLLDLEETDNGARLAGPHVVVADALAEGEDFRFPRHDPRFEEVQAYYWIDFAQRELRTLGFDLVDYAIPVYVHDDIASGGGYYRGTGDGQGEIHLGSHNPMLGGNVVVPNSLGEVLSAPNRGYHRSMDVPEDAEVILHEYGHAVFHSQGADAADLNEGFADFLSASFLSRRSNGTWDWCMEEWFGQYNRPGYAGGNPPCYRILKNDMTAPSREEYDRAYHYHYVCQVWSGALWDIREKIGRENAERLALEANFLMASAAYFDDGFEALLVADALLNGGAHAQTIVEEAADRNVTGLVVTPEVLATIRGAALAPADAAALNNVALPGAALAAAAVALAAARRQR